MKKNLMLFVLFAALLVALPSAKAAPAQAGSMDNFTEILPYENLFTDVPAGKWYAPYVGKAYSYGLIAGVGGGHFDPGGTLSVAEAVAMADRVHSIYFTGTKDFAEGDPWYVPYVDYALENGILAEAPSDYADAITRARFASLLSRAMPIEALENISSVENDSIPDVASDSPYCADIYMLYRAGILSGSDDRGSARPNDSITRAEAAAILTRMADRSERRSITLPPPVIMYAADGRTKAVKASMVAANEAVGWYRYPVMRIYSVSGDNKVIPVQEKNDWIKAGWYAGHIAALPSNFKSTTTLPAISINTNGPISKTDEYTSCTVSVFNVGEDMALSGVTGGIRVRGNASAVANPPPYRIKFDKKQNLLGLNDGAKTKSWVLLTDADGAVAGIKNDIAFRLGRTLLEPDGYYCSDARYVHVYLNGKFWGVYLLAEQNQVNKNRVDVYEPEEGYTGTDIGYLVELDNYSETPYFVMNYEHATVKDVNGKKGTFRSHTYAVKSDVYDQSQVDFIAKYVRGAFKIVYEACEKGNFLTFDKDWNVVPSSYKSAKEAVEAAIDVRSFADMYILYEIMHDYDVGGGSFYLCVDFSEGSKYTKLTCNAPWDFNWTCMGSTTTYFAGTWNIPSKALGDRSNPWFMVLFKQGWFRDLIKEKWAEAGGGTALNACVQEELSIIDANMADIKRKNGDAVSSGKVYLGWITERINWLDSVWKK